MNLLTDKWIKAIRKNGKVTEESLASLLRDAKDIYDVSGRDSFGSFSILWLSLFVFARFCHFVKSHNEALGSIRTADGKLDAFISEQARFFDLLGFMQSKNLKEPIAEIQSLRLTYPDNEESVLSRQNLIRDARPASPEEAAEILVSILIFGRGGFTVGTKGTSEERSYKGACGMGGLNVLLMGDSLWDMFRLNLLFLNGEDDKYWKQKLLAHWEADFPASNHNYLDLFNRHRSLRLIGGDDGRVSGFMSKKDDGQLVDFKKLSCTKPFGDLSNLAFMVDKKKKENNYDSYNPHRPFKKKEGDDMDHAVGYDGEAIWPQFDAIVGADTEGEHYRAAYAIRQAVESPEGSAQGGGIQRHGSRGFLRVRVCAAMIKQKTLLDVIDETFMIPQSLFDDEPRRIRFVGALSRFRQMAEALQTSIWIAAKTASEKKRGELKMVQSAKTFFLGEMGIHFPELLHRMNDDNFEEAIREWDMRCVKTAKKLLYEVLSPLDSLRTVKSSCPYVDAIRYLASQSKIYEAEPNAYKEARMMSQPVGGNDQEIEKFISKLYEISHDTGRMAGLRQAFGKDLETAEIVNRNLDAPLPPPSEKAKRRAFVLTAGIFAMLRGNKGPSNFGRALAVATRNHSRKNMRARFYDFLRTPPAKGSYCAQFRSLVGMMKYGGTDYQRLLVDLMAWERQGRPVQGNWLFDFDNLKEEQSAEPVGETAPLS